MYLITLLPYEINDDILLLLGNFDLAVLYKRFWVASQLISDIEQIDQMDENDSTNIIPFLDIEKKNVLFFYTIEHGHDKVVKFLLADPRVDPSVEDNWPIRMASYNGNFTTVKLLLSDPRVDPSVNNNDAICVASCNGKFNVVEILLKDPRVDPSTRNNYPFHMASIKGNKDIVNLLKCDSRVDQLITRSKNIIVG